MTRHHPLRPSIDHTPAPRSVTSLGDDATTRILDSLASETARNVVEALAQGPATASDLADAVDTSLQNVQYHLQNLREASLVTDAGTWYSSKGAEMTVYALTSDRIEFEIRPPDRASSADANARGEGDAGEVVKPSDA